MTETIPGTTMSDEERTGALVGRLFEAALGAADLVAVYVGDRMGLYRELASAGSRTSAELAASAGIDERYAREWLEQQAVTGILEVHDPSLPAAQRRFSLPPAHAEALIDLDSMASISPIARAFVAAIQSIPQVLTAFRTGGGVPWSAYGPDMIESQGDFNRAWIVQRLGTEYLPSIADVHERLQADPPARIADVACGVGWSSVAIARAYPKVRIEGLDPDDSSIAIAQAYARQEGVDDRVRFHARDAAAIDADGPFDFAIVVEAIHDMARPVEVLSAIRRALAPGGTLIVADEKVAETFTVPGDDVERLMYAFSFLVCLPAGRAEDDSAATGTVMRPDTLRSYALEAGFRDVEILEHIEHDTLRFYRISA